MRHLRLLSLCVLLSIGTTRWAAAAPCESLSVTFPLSGARTVLDVSVKVWETNNPYLIFPVPPNVKAAVSRR